MSHWMGSEVPILVPKRGIIDQEWKRSCCSGSGEQRGKKQLGTWCGAGAESIKLPVSASLPSGHIFQTSTSKSEIPKDTTLSKDRELSPAVLISQRIPNSMKTNKARDYVTENATDPCERQWIQGCTFQTLCKLQGCSESLILPTLIRPILRPLITPKSQSYPLLLSAPCLYPAGKHRVLI